MATTSTGTSFYPPNPTVTNNFRSTYTTPLRAAFVAGNKIKASDINLLRSAITEFNAHTHSAIDYKSIGNFGNNGPRTVIAANPRISDAMSGGLTPTAVTATSKITATTVNTYVAACNATRNHVHNIFDQTS